MLLRKWCYEKSARLIGEYPGIFYFTVGGGANHYGYMSIKNQKLSFEDLWEENYASESTDTT